MVSSREMAGVVPPVDVIGGVPVTLCTGVVLLAAVMRPFESTVKLVLV